MRRRPDDTEQADASRDVAADRPAATRRAASGAVAAGSRLASSRAVRVVGRHVVQKGPLLAAGLTYQALFALFSALWVGFSVAGFVVAGNDVVRDELIAFIQSAVPGVIKDDTGAGVVEPGALMNASVFGWTGTVALVGLLFSSIRLFGSMRDSVRTVFRAPQPATPLLRLIARDLVLALVFGATVLVSASISLLSTTAVTWGLRLVGLSPDSDASAALLRLVGLVLVFVFDTAVLAVLFRVLAGLHIPARRLLAGSAIGGAGFVFITFVGGTLLRAAGSNPLLASFAAIVGLLLVINLLCQVLLLAAGWIAVGMDDIGVLADPHAEAERLRLLEEARLAEEAQLGSRRARAGERLRALASRLPRGLRSPGRGPAGRDPGGDDGEAGGGSGVGGRR
ncbi:YihY/virulence factor BrkB family protein [Frigoribacterium sp. CFBP 13729]|uniref:YihY/virulence factor BrkB family protein n=1 Tax=unclassified Frigoribacterium TaxID=2627005 RepID=UPI00177F196B|nr:MULTISPECIES: YihY/virulence factor BrkB family protein [unclassified Frigoribacterium]MBD8584992.1 YihY/virulence factor BrkB family protein [Frigoribacterium sp. CFBP 8766]MBD8609750.1 YihY/virulence factor BrkB family protein [Frigoribacterium sp. CFBP 13729]